MGDLLLVFDVFEFWGLIFGFNLWFTSTALININKPGFRDESLIFWTNPS